MFKFILTFSLLLAIKGSVLQAAEVSFTASAPQQVAAGERFRVVFSLDARPGEFIPPAFTGFQVVAGPSQSSSSSTQIINNQVTTSVSYSYSYVLQASQEGRLSIEPAKATVNGKVYESNALLIQVSGQATPGSQPSGASPATPAPSAASEKDIFVRASVNNTNPFQGEQVIVSYRLFTRIPVNQYSIEKLPSFQGFWSENLSGGDAGNTTTEVIDGVSYRVAEIRRVALFPQRSGQINIEPLEVEALVRRTAPRRQSLFDDFFGGSPFDAFQSVQQTLVSNAIQLQVKPLPSQNRPAAFSGMVGNLDISAKLSHESLGVNDAANLTITISGRGNLRMLDKPQLNFPLNLEVFDPSLTDNIRSSNQGISGNREFNFTLIPRTPGTFEIPSVSFVYFDPSAGKYVTKTTDAFVLEVSGTALADGSSGEVLREQMRVVGSDIRFIVSRPFTLRPLGTMFYRSNMFYLMLALPFVMFASFLVYWRRQIMLQSNKALQRNRQAEKLSKKRLQKARQFLKENNPKAFYDEISRSLWGYIGDKLNIQVAQLSRERIKIVFEEKKVAEHLSGQFLEALDDCEYARFAPGDPRSLMDEVYRKTNETIISLEKELRNKR